MTNELRSFHFKYILIFGFLAIARNIYGVPKMDMNVDFSLQHLLNTQKQFRLV